MPDQYQQPPPQPNFVQPGQPGKPAKPKSGLASAIVKLIATALLIALGVFAYQNGYVLLLFGFIPLNGIAFMIFAVVSLVWAVLDLTKALQARKNS
jgi:hypothetical protein